MTTDSAGLDILDLDALVRPVGRVKVRGKLYEIMPISGRGMQLFAQMAAKEITVRQMLETTQTIVGDIIPALPKDDLGRLTMDQLTAIAERAQLTTRTVERVVGRAEKNVSARSGKAKRKPPR
jgi:hypothetical protein